jgi:hypothetical protein
MFICINSVIKLKFAFFLAILSNVFFGVCRIMPLSLSVIMNFLKKTLLGLVIVGRPLISMQLCFQMLDQISALYNFMTKIAIECEILFYYVNSSFKSFQLRYFVRDMQYLFSPFLRCAKESIIELFHIPMTPDMSNL